MTAISFTDNSDLFMKLSGDIEFCCIKEAPYTLLKIVAASIYYFCNARNVFSLFQSCDSCIHNLTG
jgi:hypothetical protein